MLTDITLGRRAFGKLTSAAALALLTGCGKKDEGEGANTDERPTRLTMVTGTGSIADQPYNQLAWDGLLKLSDEYDWEVAYIESTGPEVDYIANLTKAIDEGATLVWGIGTGLVDDINIVARDHPELQFAVIDGTNDNNSENLTGVLFNSQECAFAVGYIAARVSESGQIGFIGGITSDQVKTFEFGFYAGVEYANSLLDKRVTYQAKYAESYSDVAKGRSIAQQMIRDGCDVLFHAAGGTGLGMLEACNDAGVWCIGVDQDQAIMYPEYSTIITSAIKRVDEAIVSVSTQIVEGILLGGDNMNLGAVDNAVGIAETHDRLDEIDPTVYEDALKIIEQIKDGDIAVPRDQKGFEEYLKTL